MLLLGRESAANAGKVWGIIDRQVLLHGLRTAPFFPNGEFLRFYE